jgi:hypothetical protein
MDIGNFTKPTGNFLSATDVKLRPTIPFVITGEATLVKNEKFSTEKLRVEGQFNIEDKIVDLSKTNARFIEKILGSDTKKWIGHSIHFEVYKTKTSDGKMVDALNVNKAE